MPSKIVEAARKYEAAGWQLVPLEHGQKRPRIKNWSEPGYGHVIEDWWPGNIGLLHAWSLTCCIDIDQLKAACGWLLLEHGIELEHYLARDVQISSGTTDHGKLIYRVSEVLPTATYAENGHHVLQFRCGTRRGTTTQDALPPSVHPSGRCYEWVNGDWRDIRMIPDELLAVWKSLLNRHEKRAPAEKREITEGEAEKALSFLDPDAERNRWVEISMAFHEAGGTFEAWDEWCSRGDKYEGSDDTWAVWSSFRRGGGIGPGTLFHFAGEAGYVAPPPPRPTVEEMFGDIELGAPEQPAIREEIEREIDALTPGAGAAEVSVLLRRAVMVDEIRRMSEAEIKELCGKIAHNSGLTKTDLVKDFKAFRKQYNKQYSANINKERALEPLPKEGRPQKMQDLVARFVYIGAGPYQNHYFDRLTANFIAQKTFDTRYRYVMEEFAAEGGAVPAPSLMLSNSIFQTDGVVYFPGRLEGVYHDGARVLLNTWVPDGVSPRQGDPTPWLDHLEWLVPNAEERVYLIRWFAFMLQHQDQKINHNVMLGGASRIGKDAAILPVVKALGENCYTLSDATKLEDKFQDWAINHKLVVINELMEGGVERRQIENQLKQFGASPPEWVDLRAIHKGATKQPNLIQIIAQSNYRDALHLTSSPHRWFCVWCPERKPRAPRYYRRLYEWLHKEGGNAIVAHHLMYGVDVSDFDRGASAPESAWRHALVETSNEWDIVTPLVEQMIEDETPPFDKPFFKLDEAMSTIRGALFDIEDRKRVTQPRVAKALREHGCVSSNGAVIRDGEKLRKLRLWARPEISYLDGKTGKFWKDEADLQGVTLLSTK